MKNLYRILSILAAACACGCSHRPAPRPVEPVRVQTVEAMPASEALATSYVGVVEEESSAALSFPVMGTILKMEIGEGERVVPGQVIAVLDDTSARSTLEAARAALDQAEDAYRRMKRLYEGESLPEIKIVEIETRLDQARAACRIAEKNLADCTLRAPFAGVVGRKTSEAGANVLPIQPVATLLRIDGVKVRFAVPEDEIARLGRNAHTEIRVPALGERIYIGTTLEKGAAANPAVHTYDARIPLANPAGELLPGMVCRVRVEAPDTDDRLAVPARAVQQRGDGTRFVWVVRDGAAERRTVATGRIAGNGIEILSGLSAGERVITDGFQKIGEGSKVIL